jgi:hypothetical protein
MRGRPVQATGARLVTEQGGDPVAHYLAVEPVPGTATDGKAYAVCGRVFLPAALSAPVGRPCPLCEAVLELALARS